LSGAGALVGRSGPSSPFHALPAMPRRAMHCVRALFGRPRVRGPAQHLAEPLASEVPEQTPEDLESLKTAAAAEAQAVEATVGAAPQPCDEQPPPAAEAACRPEQAPTEAGSQVPAPEQAAAAAETAAAAAAPVEPQRQQEALAATSEVAPAPAAPAELQRQEAAEPGPLEAKRRDPATGKALTYQALLKQYKDQYSDSELESYWEQSCVPLKGGGQGKDGSSAQKRGKPKPKRKA